MKKWKVTLETVIAADTREEAWREARKLMERKHDGFVNVVAVSMKPVQSPEEWIAVNEL